MFACALKTELVNVRVLDLDYNDTGARMTTMLHLDANENVWKITLTALLERHDASATPSDMYCGILDMKGTGTYSVQVYAQNGNEKTSRRVVNHAYNWNSSDRETKYFKLFQEIAGGGSGDGPDDYTSVTLVLDNPTSNPLSTFDLVPLIHGFAIATPEMNTTFLTLKRGRMPTTRSSCLRRIRICQACRSTWDS